jgi:type IV pilus assembly protein PilB
MLTGDVFVEEGLITPYQLQLAITRQVELGGHDPIARVMVTMGLISEKDRVRCLGKVWDIPFVDVNEFIPNDDALRLLSPSQAKKFKALPLGSDGSRMAVALANPLDVFLIDELRAATGLEIQPLIAVEDDLLKALNTHFKTDVNKMEQIAGVMKEFEDVGVEISSVAEDAASAAEQNPEDEAPVIRLANLIINQAVMEKASDIHIEPRKEDILVRFRVDGIMHEAMRLPKKITAPLTSRFKIVANMDIAEKRAPQDSRISATINGRPYDFRVSTLPIIYGEKIVMRVLDKGGINVGLEKLGFLPHNLKILYDLASRSYGICLVTGPTGSGKSTTLYSLINQTNDGLKNIITIEDPVEYELDSINQCSVNVRAGMTFAAGLRSMLRQDPDVIMVGEMRDEETATIAMEAALTGHLVFSTLHTNDASSAPNRLFDMGVEPFLISSSLNGILAQRLVRKICDNCKETYTAHKDLLLRYGFPVPTELGANTNGQITLFRGRGCELCKDSGFKGRTGIHELLVITDEIKDEIIKRGPSHKVKEIGVSQGMKTLQTDAMLKVLMGVTHIDEVVRVLYA